MRVGLALSVEKLPQPSAQVVSRSVKALTKKDIQAANYQVYYCNRSCQKANWKLHKPICKALPYKLGSSPELGNFMLANKDLKQGEVLNTFINFDVKCCSNIYFFFTS